MLPVLGGIFGSIRAMWSAVSTSSRVHLPVRVGAEPLDLVERPPAGRGEALLGPAVLPPAPRTGDERRDVVVGPAQPERLPEVHPAPGVQAGEPGAVSGDAAPVAARAERSRVTAD